MCAAPSAPARDPYYIECCARSRSRSRRRVHRSRATIRKCDGSRFSISPRPNCADKFSVAHRDFTAHGDDASAGLRISPTFERAVIDVHQLRLRGNLSAILRIVDDQVRIGAELNRTLAREQSESLRRLRARDIDERCADRACLVFTPWVKSRFTRSSSDGMPFGIFVKSSWPIGFCVLKSNGA